MSREAMKLALEALETERDNCEFWDKEDGAPEYIYEAITALREALAEQPAQQEPVAYLCENAVGHKYFRWKKPSSTYKPIALYTSPPAQQEPLTDIYRSFEQWKSGNVLEHGVPRAEHYSEAQLDLVEMGWNYGYDAGRAVEQALDKKAENARELGLDYEPAQQEPEYIQLRHKEEDGFSPWGQPLDPKYRHDKWAAGVEMRLLYTSPQPVQQEPVAWKNAAIRLGEVLSSVGPDGYYDMTAEQWLDWAMDQRPHGKNSLPAQRTWVGLSDEERKLVRNSVGYNQFVTAGEYAEHVQKATEFKLREKNT